MKKHDVSSSPLSRTCWVYNDGNMGGNRASATSRSYSTSRLGREVTQRPRECLKINHGHLTIATCALLTSITRNKLNSTIIDGAFFVMRWDLPSASLFQRTCMTWPVPSKPAAVNGVSVIVALCINARATAFIRCFGCLGATLKTSTLADRSETRPMRHATRNSCASSLFHESSLAV